MPVDSKSRVKRYNNYRKYSWLILIGGLVFLVYGYVRYFYTNPDRGTNLLTQQPVIVDGSITLILGIGMLFLGLYRIIYSKRSFNNQINLEKEIAKIEEQNRKQMKK